MIRPRIFYFCYSHDRPNGGQKHTYRHVDILNQNGFDATIVHPGVGYRLRWFSNNTPILDLQEYFKIVDSSRDFTVLPEDLGLRILEFPGRKLIFNKNVFHGFTCYGDAKLEQYPYSHPEVVAAFAVSTQNEEVLRFTYPNLAIYRMFAEIDPALFQFCPLQDKKPQIVYVHKAPESIFAIRHIVSARTSAGLNGGTGFSWHALESLTQVEIANALKQSLLLVFPSVYEGLPRLVLEAMACGCLVAAYGNGPLCEILPSRYAFPHSDLLGIVSFIEEVILSYPADIASWSSIVDEGRRIAEAFTLERQMKYLINAWNEILQM